MATVINNPGNAEPSANSNASGMGFFMGMIVLLVIVLLVFYFGLPMVRSAANSGPSVQVPDQVDVNVKTPEQ